MPPGPPRSSGTPPSSGSALGAHAVRYSAIASQRIAKILRQKATRQDVVSILPPITYPEVWLLPASLLLLLPAGLLLGLALLGLALLRRLLALLTAHGALGAGHVTI